MFMPTNFCRTSGKRDPERMWRALIMVVSGMLLQEKNLSEGLPQASAPADSAPASFITLLHDMWHWRTQESPEFATQVGINDNTAGRLDSFSMERFNKRKEHCIKLLKRAEMTATENMTVENQMNLDIFKEQIRNYIENFKYLKYFIPVTSFEGPHLHLQHLVSGQMTLESYNDFQKLLARYGEFPRQADEILSIMENNIATKIMPHQISMEKILDQFSFLEDSVVKSVFFAPFLHIPLNLPPEQRRTLRQQAQERISMDLLPAFMKLKTYLKETYLNQTRPEPGINSIEDGDEYYTAALQFYTSTKLTPQEIHALGVAEIRRLQDELLEISTEANSYKNSTLKEILDHLRQGKEFYFSTREELLEAFRTTIYEKIKKFLPSVFKNLPLDNLTINGETTLKMKRGRPAWYEGPSLDGSRPGLFHIDTQELNLISKHEVTPLSLHLSYPGQHLHAVFLQISPSIPTFRKIIDASHWGLAPAEFSHNPAFVEGWALYSEFIGEEMGLYDTTMKRLVKVARELATASFLTVDTGIHSLGWSIQEAKNFMLENTALPKTTIERNLKRVVTWPGQTCSAKVGEIKLKELRKRAENALGTSFNLEEFHNVLLKCTSSLNVVQKCVTNYISEKIRLHEERSSGPQSASGQDLEPESESGQTNPRIPEEQKGASDISARSEAFCHQSHLGRSQPYLLSTIIYILIYSNNCIT